MIGFLNILRASLIATEVWVYPPALIIIPAMLAGRAGRAVDRLPGVLVRSTAARRPLLGKRADRRFRSERAAARSCRGQRPRTVLDVSQGPLAAIGRRGMPWGRTPGSRGELRGDGAAWSALRRGVAVAARQGVQGQRAGRRVVVDGFLVDLVHVRLFCLGRALSQLSCQM